MSGLSDSQQQFPSLLEQISTHWTLISDPLQFVLRYAPAVRHYLAALIKDPHDTEDVTQNFLLRVLKQPFCPTQVHRGRFRDYLKAALRNAALTHFRRANQLRDEVADFDDLAAPAEESAADQAWITEWRNCLLKRSWEALEQHERRNPAGLAYTVLRLATDFPTEDSTALAARASERTGRPLRPDAFRKQLSRARRLFAELLIDAIRQTLIEPDPQEIREELADLGLMASVRDFLPEALRGESS
jgi:hypothetical protein